MEKSQPSILIDENLSRKLTSNLSILFPGSTHIATEELLHAEDIEIWEFARNMGFSILTKDWDYNL